MPDAAKWMKLAAVGGVFFERWLLRRFLLGVTTLLMLSIAIGVALAALVADGLYLGYRLMLLHGMSVEAALLATGGVALLLLIILCLIAAWRFRLLRRAITPRFDLPLQMEKTAEAFISGLLEPSEH